MPERFHFKRLDRVRRLLQEHLPEIASIRVTLKRPGYAGLCMKYVSDFEAELQQAGALESAYGRRKREEWQVVFEAVDAWVLEAVQAHLVEAGLQSAVYQIRVRVGNREPAQSLVCTDLAWTGPLPEEATRLTAGADASEALEPVLIRTLEAQQEQNRQLLDLLRSRLTGELTGAPSLRELVALAGGSEAWLTGHGLASELAGDLDAVVEGPLGPMLSERGLVSLISDPQLAITMSVQLLEVSVQLRAVQGQFLRPMTSRRGDS